MNNRSIILLKNILEKQPKIFKMIKLRCLLKHDPIVFGSTGALNNSKLL